MLTRALAIATYEPGRIVPDRLTRRKHDRYAAHAERLLAIYRAGVGLTRRELHCAVREVFAGEPNCPVRRIDAFAKLLDDVSIYESDGGGKAAALRKQVFLLAAPLHPLRRSPTRQFPHEETAVKANLAAQLGRSWDAIDGALFADVMEFRRLKSFEGYTDGLALLARYNVAQVQAALFDAAAMTVWASEDFKTILRYAKLAGLMHTIHATRDGRYVFRFDGPASILHATHRYGAALARFLPALIACRGWRLHAVVRTHRRGWKVSLDLAAEDGLSSHLPPPSEFDSGVEEEFARRWGTEPRRGWSLLRERAILHRDQKVFVPDFVFRHSDGRSALLEIIGFWTPEYVAAKAKTLHTFANHRILLAVGASAGKIWHDLPSEAIRYKQRLKVEDVLQRLDS